MIHSHHPVPKMEIAFNCPGEVVVPKIFLFVTRDELSPIPTSLFSATERMSY